MTCLVLTMLYMPICLICYRSLVMGNLDVQEHEQPPDIEDPVREKPASTLTVEGGMDSEVEGDSSDSETWFMETHDLNDEDSGEFEEEVIDDEEYGNSSGTEEQEGIAIESRRRKNEYKRLAAKRLKEAIAKLPRDWKDTTVNWDLLTLEEMEVLAQDPKALGKMRGDGWNMGKWDWVLHVVYQTCTDTTHVVYYTFRS